MNYPRGHSLLETECNTRGRATAEKQAGSNTAASFPKSPLPAHAAPGPLLARAVTWSVHWLVRYLGNHLHIHIQLPYRHECPQISQESVTPLDTCIHPGCFSLQSTEAYVKRVSHSFSIDKSPFARLSVELRLEIYDFVLTRDRPIRASYKGTSLAKVPRRGAQAITRTCHEIRGECAQIYYKLNTFEVGFSRPPQNRPSLDEAAGTIWSLHSFIKGIGPKNAAALRKVVVVKQPSAFGFQGFGKRHLSTLLTKLSRRAAKNAHWQLTLRIALTFPPSDGEQAVMSEWDVAFNEPDKTLAEAEKIVERFKGARMGTHWRREVPRATLMVSYWEQAAQEARSGVQQTQGVKVS